MSPKRIITSRHFSQGSGPVRDPFSLFILSACLLQIFLTSFIRCVLVNSIRSAG